RPGTVAAGTCRATCHQPSRAAIAATGSAMTSTVQGLTFITDAAATASGEGVTRAAKASRPSASPSARRGASWPAGCSSARPPADATLGRIEGKNFNAPDGSKLQIKGISLGNWLMPEGYMFKFEVAKAPRQIYGAFDRLLGPQRAARFWEQFRDAYITQDD